jgi:hypothetical protein
MDSETLKKHQQDWFDENAPLGRDLGYPECCVKAFCDQPPALLRERRTPSKDDQIRYKAGCIRGEFTGFIPCINHAKEIVAGRITLASLVKNRHEMFPPFPTWGRRG